MSVLITGGTGFIGAEVTQQLLDQGEKEIHVLHRSGNFQRVAHLIDQINPIQCNLADGRQLLQIVESVKPRIIYHLGAMLSVLCEQDPQTAVQVNAMGTFHLLEAARLHQVPQFLFASSIASYGADIKEPVITDATLQRPQLIYGITKVFGEQLGYYYKRKYDLDFRGLRYPSIIGPGVKTPGVVQYTSWVIEQCAKGNPFTITVTPETAVPVMYYKEAAQAIIQMGRVPVENIKTINYNVDGSQPTPTAGELVQMVRHKIPSADITFEPNLALQPLLDQLLRPLDNSKAQKEWHWQPTYTLENIVDDFLQELEEHPERYN